MKIPKCSNCGKNSKGYKEYYNPEVAKLWGLHYCEPCRVVTLVREYPLNWKNFPSRHRWWIPVIRVVCLLLFLTAVGLALGGLEIGTWPRIISGVIAFLIPGIYGALKGTGTATVTESRSLDQLKRSLQEWEDDDT